MEHETGLDLQGKMWCRLEHVSEFRSSQTVTEYAINCQRNIEDAGNYLAQQSKNF